MGFEKGNRRGIVWNDVQALDKIIKKEKYTYTNKDERECEKTFSSSVIAQSEKLTGKVYSQQDQEASVKSVYCFGKKHRPDMSIDEDGIAVEIKYIKDSFDGIKQALGQSLIYRLRYKFVFNIFIISEKNKDVYQKAANGEEKDLLDIFRYMADELNIFSYLAPSFTLQPNIKGIIECSGFT